MTLQLIDYKSKRRDKLVIMTEIMGICKNGSFVTQIMFKANLSFAQLKQYLASLSELGLLEKLECNGRHIYRSTRKGQEFMKMQQEIINLLNKKDQKESLRSYPFEINPFQQNKTPLMY